MVVIQDFAAQLSTYSNSFFVRYCGLMFTSQSSLAQHHHATSTRACSYMDPVEGMCLRSSTRLEFETMLRSVVAVQFVELKWPYGSVGEIHALHRPIVSRLILAVK